MTRLFYEQMLQKEFLDLQWVRVCTSAPFTVTVYACDANLDLSEEMVLRLKQFLKKKGMLSRIHNVKHYFELQKDEVFPIGQIPDIVKRVALIGNTTVKGVQAAVKVAFPFIDSDHFLEEKNEVTFYLRNNEQWTSYQIQFVEMMLTEILPVGSSAKLVAAPFGI